MKSKNIFKVVVLLGFGAMGFQSSTVFADGAKQGKRKDAGRILRILDLNQDGEISASEIDARKTGQFESFDSDNSASFNLGEFQQLWLEQMRERMVDRFQHLDADGDGEVTREEFSAPIDRMLARHDANSDGALSRDELPRKRKKQRRQSDSSQGY
ncbi:MAG: hypothetical protein AAF402_07390 [Pseudomonadota bacterium]